MFTICSRVNRFKVTLANDQAGDKLKHLNYRFIHRYFLQKRVYWRSVFSKKFHRRRPNSYDVGKTVCIASLPRFLQNIEEIFFCYLSYRVD
jgi:hypothetical protein